MKTYQTGDFVHIGDGYFGIWYDSNYGAVQKKWLLVKSEQATKRENHALQKSHRVVKIIYGKSGF